MARSHKKILLLFAPSMLLIGAVPEPAPAPPVPVISEATGPVVEVEPAIQPFDLDASRRMAVPVTVGGRGPFFFLVDTGAERTVIASELAERLGLVSGAKLQLATIGSSIATPSFRIASLEMTNLRLLPFDAPAFAGRHIGAAGLIGVDMMRSQRLLIDFRAETMRITPSKRNERPIIRDADAIVVSARNIAGRLILSDARIDGRRIDVIVDTGAQTSVGNMALKKLIAGRKQNRFPFFPTTLTSVSGEKVPAERTAIRRITIEGASIDDLPISFADSQAFRALGLNARPALLMGMDSLQLFDRVEIDFSNRRVIFQLPDGAARRSAQQLAVAANRPQS